MTPEQKERKKEYMREYYLKNKQKLNQQHSNYKLNNIDKIREYRQTTDGKKTDRIYDWKRRGVIHDDFDELYSLYIATTECMVCNATFKNSKDRHLDHSHETGEYRNVLCQNCNCFDNWAKKA